MIRGISELYHSIGADVSVIKQYASIEGLMEKVLIKFTKDDSLDLIEKASEERNIEQARLLITSIVEASQSLGFVWIIYYANRLAEIYEKEDGNDRLTYRERNAIYELRMEYIRTIAAIERCFAGNKDI